MQQVPASFYGGLAFKIDTSAATNFYIKRQAEETAKQNALDKYFSTLTDKASPTGVRGQDQEAFTQAVQNYQDFYTQNRKALASGKDFALQSKARELAKMPFQIMAESKEELASAKAAGQVFAGVNQDVNSWTDETIGIDKATSKPMVDSNGNFMGLHAQEQPLYNIDPATKSLSYNPNHKKFDLISVQYNPKLLTANELESNIDNQVNTIQPGDISSTLVPVKGKPGYVVPTKTIGYKPEQIKQIGDAIINLYGNKNVHATVHAMYPWQSFANANPVEFKEADDFFKNIYQRPIANEGEYLAAIQMKKRSVPKTELGTEQMTEEAKSQMSFNNSKRLKQIEKSLDPTALANSQNTELAFERIPNQQFGTFKMEGGKILDSNGQPYTSADNNATVDIPVGSLNADVIAQFPTGTKLRRVQGISAVVKNGIIQYGLIKGTKGESLGQIDRVSLFNKQFSKNTPAVQINNVTSGKAKKGALD